MYKCKHCTLRRKIMEYVETTEPAILSYRGIGRYAGCLYPQTIKNHIENLKSEGFISESESKCGHFKYLTLVG